MQHDLEASVAYTSKLQSAMRLTEELAKEAVQQNFEMQRLLTAALHDGDRKEAALRQMHGFDADYEDKCKENEMQWEHLKLVLADNNDLTSKCQILETQVRHLEEGCQKWRDEALTYERMLCDAEEWSDICRDRICSLEHELDGKARAEWTGVSTPC